MTDLRSNNPGVFLLGVGAQKAGTECESAAEPSRQSDLLPAFPRRCQAVETAARAHFQQSGFAEIRTPLMEVTDA